MEHVSKLRLLALLLPSAFVLVFAEISRMPFTAVLLGKISIIVFYILTVWIIISYVKYVPPFSPWLLPLSFAVSPLPQYIYDTMYPRYSLDNLLDYSITFMVVRYYALPFLAVSLIIAAILLVRVKTLKSKESANEN